MGSDALKPLSPDRALESQSLQLAPVDTRQTRQYLHNNAGLRATQSANTSIGVDRAQIRDALDIAGSQMEHLSRLAF